MKITISYNRNNITLEQDKKILYIYPFGIAVNKIPYSEFEAKGDLIVGTGSGALDRLAVGTDGYVLTAASGEAGGMKWAASEGGGGGEATLTNKSGSSVESGDVVIWSPGTDKSFTTTTLERDRRICGVVKEDIANNGEGKVVLAYAIQTVKVTGNVARGQWLITSTTVKRAKASGYHKDYGCIGMALTEYTGGESGTVDAIIIPDHYVAVGDGIVFSMGGYNGVPSAIASIEKFTKANETTSSCSGVITAATSGLGGCWDKNVSTHCYNLEGANYLERMGKYLYATDTFSNVKTSTYTNKLWFTRSLGNSTYGRITAGYYGGAGYAGEVAVTYATDSDSVTAFGIISSARTNPCSFNNSAADRGYIAAGGNGTYVGQTAVWKQDLTAGGAASLLAAAYTNGRCFAGSGSDNIKGIINAGHNASSYVTNNENLLYATDAISMGAATWANCQKMYYGIFEAAAVSYNLGGTNGSVIDTIIKHNISADTISTVSQTMSAPRYDGSMGQQIF